MLELKNFLLLLLIHFSYILSTPVSLLNLTLPGHILLLYPLLLQTKYMEFFESFFFIKFIENFSSFLLLLSSYLIFFF